MDSWIIPFVAAILLGMSKAGLKGLGVAVVALMAYAYGAKASTGIALLLFLIGDTLAIFYFRRDIRWDILRKFLPPVLLGVLLGVWIGKDLPDHLFKLFMGGVVMISVVYILIREFSSRTYTSDSPILTLIMGFCAGVATMVGNLAGAFANIYFLSTGIPKLQIIGTGGWLFFLVNIFKLPFHIYVWETISYSSCKYLLYLGPVVCLGFIIGLQLIDFFSEKAYRYFLIAVTIIGALLLFI